MSNGCEMVAGPVEESTGEPPHERPAATKDLILGQKNPTIEPVKTPDWPCDVYVRSMSSDVRDAYDLCEIAARGDKPGSNIRGCRARLAAHTVCDKDGSLIFANGDGVPSKQDIEAIGLLDSRPLDLIWSVGLRLNRLSQKDQDELLGNSEGGTGDGSGSA